MPDIIENKQVQAQIKDVTNYIQTILSVSPISIITFKASGENISVNEAAAKLIGTSVENVRKQNFRELDSWKSSGLLDKAIRVLSTGKNESFEVHFISSYGSEMWIAGRLASFYFEGQQHLLLMAVDVSERKLIEERFLENEKLLNESQNIAGLGSYVLNISTGLWKGSKALDKIFGIDGAYDRSVEGWEKLVHPDDRAMMRDHFRREVLLQRQAFDKGYRIVRQIDQAERWVHGYGKMEFDSQGNGLHMYGVIQDVTDRKLVENELRESERRFRNMIENAPEPIFIHVDKRFVYLNNAAVRLFGALSQDQLKGQSILERIHPESLAIAEERMQLTNDMRETAVPLLEEKFLRIDGSLIDVEVTAISLEYEGHHGSLVFFRDITERKLAQDALQESEERYRRMMESITDYIYTVRIENGHAVETTHGPGCLGVTGYSCEEYKRNPDLWYQMVHKDDRAKVVERAQCVVRGLKIEPFEHRIYHRDGTIRWLRNTIVVKKDDAERLISYDGLVVDITVRKQAEESLRESRARFSTIFRVNPVGVILARVSDNKFVDVNNAFCDMFGYTQEELLGHTSMEFGLWLYPQEHQKMTLELTSQGQVQQFEYKFRRKSGETGDAVLSAGLVVFGGLEHFLFVTMDITDKNKAQQKLKEAAEEWERTFNAIHDMIFIQDKDMNIVKVNQACAQALKMDPKDIIGKKCHEIAHRFDHPWPNCPFEKTKQDMQIHTEEVNDRRLGVFLQVTISPIFSPQGEFIGAVHIGKDITAMKKSQEQQQEHLREMEIFYKGSMGREERILELKKEILHLNANKKRVEEFLSEGQEALQEGLLIGNIPESQASELEDALKDALKARKIMTSMLDDNNKIREDLEKRLLELKRSQNMLIHSEKLASLGRLVSEITHEINNPLMIISGYAQLSLMSEALKEEDKNNLNIIVEECRRAKDVTKRILKFSRLSRGEVKEVDIKQCIESVVSIVERQFVLNNNVKIIRQYFDKSVPISLDEQQMHEVFMNLLNNAKEAMPDGGDITITTSLQDEHLKIDFKDTGVGMPEEVMRNIIEPFYSTKETGTGIGLDVCYGIIKAHHGDLIFESEVGKGTVATVLLPLNTKGVEHG